MRGVVLKEKKILNEALGDAIIHEKPMITIGVLVRYYFSTFDSYIECKDDIEKSKLVKGKVFETVNQFMKDNHNGYIPSKWKGIIDRTIDSYKDREAKWELVDVDNVVITRSEWEIIIKLEDRVLERLAFIMLVYQKINEVKNPNSNGWINQDIMDIFKEAGVTIKGDKKRLLLNALYKKEYISQSNNCLGTSFKIEYINTDSEDKIIIDNFNNVISYYYEFKDKVKYRVCKECGIRFAWNRDERSRKYCKPCGKKINRRVSCSEM